MTKYFNELLAKLRNTDEPKHSGQHHVFLLGTGVDYVERPTDIAVNRSYIRGETFSYAAQLVTHVLGEEKAAVTHADALNAGGVLSAASENYAHAYHSPSVDVINGADTLGTLVGDRIAKALMLALGAVAEGKEELSVSGFSRGGVEAIVLMHELERVRTALATDLTSTTPRSLAAIIADSNSAPGLALIYHASYTRQVLNALMTDQSVTNDDLALKEKLLANLNKMKANLFVLDPVPGGNLAKIGRIGWQEDVFYKELPSFVKKKHEFVQKHETSNCFKPIIPPGMPYEVIPGCHGTGDGNQFNHNGYGISAEDQNKRGIADEDKDFSGVQDLVVRRWLDFTFPDAKPGFKIDLGHEALDKVTNNYLPKTMEARSEVLLDNYTFIQKNYKALAWLETQNYDYLGQYMLERMVHFHARGNTPVDDLDAHGDGKHFVNLQHVQLWMGKTLESFNFLEKTLVEQVEWLKVNISNAFIGRAQGEGETWLVNALLDNKKNHPLIKASLSFLVNTVTQTFMRNHLTDEQKAACKACVEDTFAVLRACAEDLTHPYAAFAEQVETAIRRDLSTSMLRHQNSLLSAAQQLLRDQTTLISNLKKPHDEGNQPVNADAVRLTAVEKKQLINNSAIAWMVDVQKLYKELALLAEQVNDLEPGCDQTMLIEAWSKILPDFSGSSDKAMGLGSCKQNLEQFIQQQRKLLLADAIDVLSNMPDALQKRPQELDNDFYMLIHRQANIHNLETHVLELETDVNTLEVDVQNKKIAAASLEKQANEIAERLNAVRTPEQEAEIVVIASLKQRSTEYLQHLQNKNDGSELHQKKQTAVEGLLATLNDCKILPTARHVAFNAQLDAAKGDLLEHRDPEALRFFRDCLRILARVFSGIGFYRMAKGESPQFFKPTHGERFVEDVQQTPTLAAV